MGIGAQERYRQAFLGTNQALVGKQADQDMDRKAPRNGTVPRDQLAVDTN